MAGAAKQSTKLTGLAVRSNPIYLLNRYYKRILGILEKMPPDAGYRKHTESIIKHKSHILNSTNDVSVIEEKLGSGEIEEVIIQAQKELSLAETMLLARPWEPLMTPAPENQWKWPPK